MKKIKYSIGAFCLTAVLTGCSDFFSPKTDDILLEKEYIGEQGELYSGYMGVAACVQDVADQAVFLEGLRGDLLEPTGNAPREMWDIYNYAADVNDNTLADPKGFYNIIMNANDYIDHVFRYREKYPTVVSTNVYNGLIGGALRFKAWSYLMLAKIYGEAVYFDEPVTSYEGLDKFPLLQFDEVIEKCRLLVEEGMNGVNGKGAVEWQSVLYPGQKPSATAMMWDRTCPPAECLLAEIYLYQNEYQKVKENCIAIIKKGGETEDSYQLNLSDYNSEWKKMGREFIRFEHIAVAFYDYGLHQTNHMIEYFSNNYPNKYYLRPTEVAMNRFNTQLTSGGMLSDKYRGKDATFKEVNGEWVMQKFISGHESADKVYRNDVQISLYRAADIHMFLVEALTGMGHFQEALAFLNKGVGSYYNTKDACFLPPFADYPGCLYVTPGKAGNQSNRGIRGRVDLSVIGEFALESKTAMDTLVNIRKIDSLLIEETCLENAGEARSFYTMVRMAKRWGIGASKTWASKWIEKSATENPEQLWSTELQDTWAAKVAAKYTNGRKSTIESQLKSDISNWFIKFDLGK